MSIGEHVQIVPSELVEIVESVFGTMMNLVTAVATTQWSPDHNRLTAAVHLAGEWNGAVLFECAPAQACRFTGRFLSMDPPDNVDDVVRDVLGEIANMIGGNLKCVLMRGIHLSIPSVREGCARGTSSRLTRVRERLAFQCEDGWFWVSVVALDGAES